VTSSYAHGHSLLTEWSRAHAHQNTNVERPDFQYGSQYHGTQSYFVPNGAAYRLYDDDDD